jgi:hypothetical protein
LSGFDQLDLIELFSIKWYEAGIDEVAAFLKPLPEKGHKHFLLQLGDG